MTERTERDEHLLKVFNYIFSINNLQSYLIANLGGLINYSNQEMNKLNDQFGKGFMEESVGFLAEEFNWDIHLNKKEEPKE